MSKISNAGNQTVDDWKLLSVDEGMMKFVKLIYNCYFMTRSDVNLQICTHHSLNGKSVVLPSEIKSLFKDLDTLMDRFPALDLINSMLKPNQNISKLLTFLFIGKTSEFSLGLHFILHAKIHIMKIQDLNNEMANLIEELDKLLSFNYYRLIKELELWENASFEIKEESRQNKDAIKRLRQKVKDHVKVLKGISYSKKNEIRNYINAIISKTTSINFFKPIKFNLKRDGEAVKDRHYLIHALNYLDENQLQALASWKDNDFHYVEALQIFFKLINFRRKIEDLKNPNELKQWLKVNYFKLTEEEKCRNKTDSEILEILNEIEIINSANKDSIKKEKLENQLKKEMVRMPIEEEEPPPNQITTNFEWFKFGKLKNDSMEDKKMKSKVSKFDQK
jgi:hypothetical protein